MIFLNYKYKFNADNITEIIVGSASGVVLLFIAIVGSKNSSEQSGMKKEQLEIKEGFLDLKEGFLDFKTEQLEMKSDIIEIGSKFDKVVFQVTEKDLKDAERERKNDKKFYILEKGYNELKTEIESNDTT